MIVDESSKSLSFNDNEDRKDLKDSNKIRKLRSKMLKSVLQHLKLKTIQEK